MNPKGHSGVTLRKGSEPMKKTASTDRDGRRLSSFNVFHISLHPLLHHDSRQIITTSTMQAASPPMITKRTIFIVLVVFCGLVLVKDLNAGS